MRLRQANNDRWTTQVRRRDASSRKVVVEECRYDTADEAEPSDLAASSSLRTATSAPEASVPSIVHRTLPGQGHIAWFQRHFFAVALGLLVQHSALGDLHSASWTPISASHDSRTKQFKVFTTSPLCARKCTDLTCSSPGDH